MRVWPMLRGLIGAITVFAWALLAIGPSHKVKDGAVDDLHHDILSASQPLSGKTLSKLADANDPRIGEGRASRDSSQLGSAPGQALGNDRDATALPGTSQDLSVGPQTSRKAELENSRPERAGTLNPPETANRDASRSPAASSNPAPGAEIAGIPPFAPRATVDLASRPEDGRADEGVARKSLSASDDAVQSPAPASPSPDSTARDTASSDAKSGNEVPTIASLLPEAPTDSPRAPQDFGEHETDSSGPLADASRPAKLPTPLPTIPDYGDSVSSDATHGSEALPIAPLLSEVPIPPPVAAAKPQQQSTGGSRRPGAAEADVGKSLQPAPSMAAPFSSEDGQPEPKDRATVAEPHSKSAVGRAHAADPKRSPAIGFAPHSTREKVTGTMRLDGRDHAPKIVASKRMTGRTGESGRSGRAPTFVDEKNRPLSSIRTAVSESEAQGVQWRLSLRRRCPSIIASSDEYDDDLVRLCRLSAGL
jgi:hypothetical protein